MATTRSRRARSRWARRRSTPIPRRTRAARATTSTSDASRKGRAGGCRLSRPMPTAGGAGRGGGGLRPGGGAEGARARLAHWLALDPTGVLLRHEAVKLGEPGEPLWLHLAGEPERVLGLAGEYMGLGLYADALELLD